MQALGEKFLRVPLRVGIDLDGVLYDFAASFRRYLVASGQILEGVLPDEEPGRWSFYEDWGFSLDEFIKLCNDGVDAGYVFRGPTRPHAVESVRRIKDMGHSVHIITDRKFGSDPVNSEIATKHWLDEHGIPYDTLTFSADKTCVPTDCFVEDKLENYDALREAGVAAFLVSRPWNYDAEEFNTKRLRRRIPCIKDYADLIEAELTQVF